MLSRCLEIVVGFCFIAAFAALVTPAKEAAPAAKLNLKHETSFVVVPADLNQHGTLFGGWTLAEMDRCAGIAVRRLLYASAVKDAVTVSVRDVTFSKAGQQKDLVFVTAEVAELGRKTVTVRVKVERESDGGKRETLADGVFVFCAYDAAKKAAVEHGLTLGGR